MRKGMLYWILYGCLAVIAIVEHFWPLGRSQTRRNKNNIAPQLFVSVPRGSDTLVDLPDGSTVWLNAASTVSYPADMSSGERHIELVGEGFFDVAQNPNHPFMVKAKDMEVEVLGTRFNIRCYPEETTYQTFVTSGKVKVRYNEQEMTLHGGQLVDLTPGLLNGPSLKLKNVLDTTLAANWTRGLLDYTNTDLPSLLQDLSRTYNVEIELRGGLQTFRFTGTISRDQPLSQNLKVVLRAFPRVTVSPLKDHRLIVVANE